MAYESSLVLISSADPNNQDFGTGFVIDQDGGYSYILTCAHVVRNVGGKEAALKVNNVRAERVAIGSPTGPDDLAVLRVEGLYGTPLLRRSIGNEGIKFTSRGYQFAGLTTAEGSVASVITVPIEGTLGKYDHQRIRGQGSSVKLWTLNIESEILPQPGYSGSPIIVNTEDGDCVIGVLSMQHAERFLAISIEVLDRVWSEQTFVPFTNREDELNLILSSSAPAYYLLDAPAGYGKSTLLRELQKRFSERRWSCAYVPLDSSVELDELAETIAEKLAIPALISKRNDDRSAGYRLGGALQKSWNNTQEGIVLFLDFDTSLNNSDLLERLIKEFIPDIKDSLENIPPFDSGDNRFRVVVAGRYLISHYNRLSVQVLPIVPSPRCLSPFKYDVIHDSSIHYLRKHYGYRVRQIADHVLYLTGGHPRCMAQILRLYKESAMSPELFVSKFSNEIWKEIVRPMVDSVVAELPNAFGMHKLMSNNVLRYMDYAALEKLIDILEISEVRDAVDFDAIDLSDELVNAALLNWNDHLFHDDITRRLICIGLRNSDGGNKFVQLCKSAQVICEEHLRDNSTHNPDAWAIEYLFQFLQQHALVISNTQQRQTLRADFIQDELPKVIQWLTTGRRAREQQKHLMRAIDEDWEFMFTVNYYLRRDDYNNNAVAELKLEINRNFWQAEKRLV